MSEEAKKKESPSADKHGGEKKDAAAAGAAGGILTKLPVLLGGVMIIEAAVLFAGFKFLGSGPKPSTGAELTEETAAAADEGAAKTDEHGGGGEHGGEHGAAAAAGPKLDKKKSYEVPVVTDYRTTNKQNGRLFVYDVTIYAVAKGAQKEKVEATIKEREGLIKDRIRTIIAQSDPEKLGGGSEPGLETLRRQVKYQLDEIIGEGIIDEVLVPRCIPFRTDY
jgi:flagellar basal body-associated protein FliL